MAVSKLFPYNYNFGWVTLIQLWSAYSIYTIQNESIKGMFKVETLVFWKVSYVECLQNRKSKEMQKIN